MEGLDDKKICEFLAKQGHRSLAKNTPRQALPTKAKRGGRRPDTMKHNRHVAHQLQVNRRKKRSLDYLFNFRIIQIQHQLHLPKNNVYRIFFVCFGNFFV